MFDHFEIFKTCVILAGGKSTRMGFDKQLLKINNIKLIDLLIDKLKYEFEDIIIVTNRPDYYTHYNIRVFKDEIIGKGPLSGFHKGLKEAKSKYVYFTACDMPNINIEYIAYMKKKLRNINIDACLSYYNNFIQPMNSFYNVSILMGVEKYIAKGDYKFKSFIQSLDYLRIEEKKANEFSKCCNMFLNLNTKKELKAYILNNQKC